MKELELSYFLYVSKKKHTLNNKYIIQTQGNNQQCMQLIFAIHNIEFHTQSSSSVSYNCFTTGLA
jgi:hypothetical protein